MREAGVAHLWRLGVVAITAALMTPIVLAAATTSASAEAGGPHPDLLEFIVVPQPPAPAPQAPTPDSALPQPIVRTGVARAAVDAALATADGSSALDLRVAVLDRGLGELALGPGASEPIYSASLSKLLLAVDMLDRRRLEGLEVTEHDVDLLRGALGPSDDDAMNDLWSRFDGADAAGRVAQRLGLTGTRGPENPSQWGEVEISAEDYLRLYQHVLGWPEAERTLVLGALAAAPAVAKDGFAQDFGLLQAGNPASALAKQGWMCCFGGRYYLHSAGLVTGPAVASGQARFVVAALSIQTQGAGWEGARERVSAAVAALSSVLAQADSLVLPEQPQPAQAQALPGVLGPAGAVVPALSAGLAG